MSGSFAFMVLAVASAGHIIASRCYLVKYQIARESGHRLYLSALTYGFACLLLAALPLTLLAWLLKVEISPFWLGIATVAVGLGFTKLYNRKFNKTKARAIWKSRKENGIAATIKSIWSAWERDKYIKVKALWKAWERDDIELVCATAATEFKPVAVTLETGKVYVGMVADTIEPSNDKSFLSILPFYSGYRDKDTLSFKLTHKYETLITGLLNKESKIINSPLDYIIVIPKERMVTIHIFNDDLYNEVSGHSLDELGNPTT